MKIASSFKDYYDIGLSYGIDPKCVYQRETQEIDVDGYGSIPEFVRLIKANERLDWIISSTTYHFYDSPVHPDTRVFLFCGKVYVYYKMSEVFITYVPKVFSEYVNLFSKFPERYKPRTTKESNRVQTVINDLNAGQSLLDIHRAANSPIIMIDKHIGRHCIYWLNPRLYEYKFQKAVNPYIAFQELSMFMVNVLGIPENPMVPVSDKSKMEGHGFNKYSFKHPVKL